VGRGKDDSRFFFFATVYRVRRPAKYDASAQDTLKLPEVLMQ